MFCEKCGKEIDNGSVFCQYCGSRVEQGYIPPDLVGRQADAHSGKPAGNAPGKGSGGKILCIAGMAGAVCLAVTLAAAAFLFVKNLIADGNLSETFLFLAEDEEGRILGGRVEKSSLPAFVRNLLGEAEEDEGEETDDSEADAVSEEAKEDPKELFEQALSELVSDYEVFNPDQRGTMRQTVDRWLNPRGVISATIKDFDGDGEEEMMVFHTEPSAENPDLYEIQMSMYEIKEGRAVIEDKALFRPYNDQWEMAVYLSENEWNEVSFRVNLVENQGHSYVMCEEESVAGAFADGQDRNYWAMIYEDGKWEYALSYTQTAGGSAGFAYTGYEFDEGRVNSQLYYEEDGAWRGTEALYGDFSTAIREYFDKYGIHLRSHPAEYGLNVGSLLADDNDKQKIFEFTNELSRIQSMGYECHAVMSVDPASAVPGETAPPLVLSSSASGGSGYLLPDVDSRYLTREEISQLSKEELRLARNEVYARHGRLFDSADLQNYFNGKSWYEGRIPAKQFSDSIFNDYERKNLDLIREIEEKRP